MLEAGLEGGVLRRNIEERVLMALSDTPVTLIQGARQVGKSTLLSMVCAQLDSRLVTLDDPSTLGAARSDPISFANQYPAGTLAIDEVQLCPELLRAVKLCVDEDRRPGRFILTGSANLLHVAGANESLAGRVETLTLHPLSQGEVMGRQEDFVAAILRDDPLRLLQGARGLSREQYAAIVAAGGYPDALRRDGRRRRAYFENYLSGVLDHDAVELSSLAHLDKLGALFQVISAQTSGELVNRSVAGLVGIPESSLHGYIRLLRDLYLINELPAWGRNTVRRAVARRKVHLADTGLAAYINRLDEQSLSNVLNGEAFGPLLETLVASELFKQQSWSAQDFSLFHYRDKDKREVDLVIEAFDRRLVAIEVKASRTVSQHDFAGMKVMREAVKDRFHCGIVLYTGSEAMPFGPDLFAAPVSAVWS